MLANCYPYLIIKALIHAIIQTVNCAFLSASLQMSKHNFVKWSEMCSKWLDWMPISVLYVNLSRLI